MPSYLTSLKNAKSWILFVVLLSFFVNLLMLTGPMYMLQVYDRVLTSRSIDTLVALTAIMAGLYLFMGIFDYGRSRIMSRYGLKWAETANQAAVEGAMRPDEMRETLRDGDMVAKSYAHPSMLGLLDMIWMPLFIVVLWALHPLLGMATLAGAGISVVLAGLTWWFTQDSEETAQKAMQKTAGLEQNLTRDAHALEAIGAWNFGQTQWIKSRDAQDDENLAHQDATGKWMTALKTWRLFFQSAILGLGAYLAVVGNLTPGAMIAGSILAGRALAPIDQLLSGVTFLIKGRQAKARLKKRFKDLNNKSTQSTPDFPEGTLEANAMSFQLPGQKPMLFNLQFRLEAGKCLAVMGDSGSGKSVLAKLTAGLWNPVSGSLTLDGIPLSHLSEKARKDTIGYVPQESFLPDGKLIDIMKGFDTSLADEMVMETARTLGLHALFASLPNGYDTAVTKGGLSLPMTVRKATLIVQALAGKKRLLVLDDICAGLSVPMIVTLRQALQSYLKEGGALMLLSDNVDILTLATHILVLEQGRTMAYGDGLRVVDTFIKSLEEGAAPTKIPHALRPAIARRRQKADSAPKITDTTPKLSSQGVAS